MSFVNCSRKVEFEKFRKDNPDYDYYINGAKQSWNEYQASYSGCKYIVLDNKGEVLGCVNIDDYSAGKSVDIIMDIFLNPIILGKLIKVKLSRITIKGIPSLSRSKEDAMMEGRILRVEDDTCFVKNFRLYCYSVVLL